MPLQKAKRERLGSVAVRRAFSITEAMNCSEPDARERADYIVIGRLAPEVLERWSEPKKPIEVIG